jgi:hypothetical protein
MSVRKENDMEIEMKIGRYVKQIGKDDLILDNGSIIQVVTQNGAWGEWCYSALTMSKKMFNELMKRDFIYLDVGKTKKENERYNTPCMFYFRFDIDKMIASGRYKVVG